MGGECESGGQGKIEIGLRDRSGPLYRKKGHNQEKA